MNVLAPLVAVVLVSACAAQTAPVAAPAPPAATGPTASPAERAASQPTPLVADPTASEPRSATATSTLSGAPGATGSTQPTEPADPRQAEPTPGPAAWSVPVDAAVSPDCVRAGGVMSIEVVTRPDAAVAYHAIYHGEQAGAPPPVGQGHGGNGGGMADGNGVYRDTWSVSPNAPVGPARIDVVVAWDGSHGRTTVTFEVAPMVAGGCGGSS